MNKDQGYCEVTKQMQSLEWLRYNADQYWYQDELRKIKFLKEAGMKRVVLARELNLHQIKEISTATDVELEFFVTGALCVSFSGNCYMSVANGERSANRGSCAQNCRLPYNLIDGHGDTLIKNSHLLSIKDFDVFLD